MTRRQRITLAVSLALSLGPLIAGCAQSKPHPEPAPEVKNTPPPPPNPSPTLDPTLRMPLPYTFSRRGVEIRVNYVEFVKGQPQVNVSLHETRGQDASVLASTLMQARDESGQSLAFAGYLRDEHAESDPTLSFKPNDHFPITLTFQPPAVSTAATHTTILVFPTGKWWQSTTPE